MDARLRALVEEVKARAPAFNISSPFGAGAPDPPTLLQFSLIESDFLDDLSEADLEQAANELGVSPDDLPGWLESLASWYTE